MEEDPPPFWLQNHHANHHHYRRRHRRTSNLFFNTGVLILILMLAAMVFLIIAIPYVTSLARQIFDPNLVKTSWNSLNIVLVLFAILCGFLSKKDDDQNNQTPRSTPLKQEVIDNNDHNLAQSSTHQWYNNDFQNDRMRRLLRRNSNSYPDLRQDSPWVVKENVWKSYDDQYYQLQRSDSQVFGYYTSVSRPQDVSILKTPPPPSPPPRPLPQPPQVTVEVVSEDETDARVIEIDAEVLSVSSDPSLVLSPISTHSTTDPPLATTYLWPPPSSPPPPPPPPPPPRQAHSSKAIKKKVKQRDEGIGNEGKWDGSIDQSQSKSKEMERRKYKEDNKNEKSHKKRGGVSVTKEFLTSFYHQRKRKKKQKRMSYDNLDEVFEPPKVSLHRSKSTPEFPPPSPPPPPPPPPPPSPPTSVIKTIFPSRKNKTKQVPYVITTPIPPPSPPPPPPPPPPPFKMPSWKFIMQGDYANMDSYNNSPRSGYSASEEDDGSPSTRKTSSPVPTLFCPSPDVNIKADDFIARFRAKLTLEKMNSIKQKQGTGPSPLGMDFGQN